MPNIATVLKAEIARVARKESRTDTQQLKKTSAQHRSDIAALKRRVQQLERLVAKLARGFRPAAAAPGQAVGSVKVRFSPKGLSTHRKRLGLSAAELGALLGVSGQSIHPVGTRQVTSPSGPTAGPSFSARPGQEGSRRQTFPIRRLAKNPDNAFSTRHALFLRHVDDKD